MEKETFEILYNTEEKYWWFAGQRYLINKFLNKYYDSRKDLMLLDVGCGVGSTLNMLNNFGRAYGIDISSKAITFCKKRGLNALKKSNVMDIKFKGNSFDVVTSLGVFYHKQVRDDTKALREIYRILKPGGRLFFTDSAMMCLYSKHDMYFHSARRYSKQELLFKFKKAGFIVEKLSYFNTLFFPIIYLSRKWNTCIRSQPKSDVRRNMHPILNSILKTIYLIELYCIQYIQYPLGVNIFAVVKKPRTIYR